MKTLALITVFFFVSCLSEPAFESDTKDEQCVPSAEICDRVDNDCDGKIDEDLGDACCFSDIECGGAFCNLVENTCVQCLENRTCTESNAAKCGDESSCVGCQTNGDCSHIEGNTSCKAGVCVSCTEDSNCPTGQKCDVDQNICSACLSDNDCADKKCYIDANNAANNICVACTTNIDCLTATDAKCGDNNECDACQIDSDCTHLSELQTCVAGLCVECNDDSPCNGKACDLQTNTCSDLDVGSRQYCQSCVSDSSCLKGGCLETNYDGEPNGRYCFQIKTGNCGRPYGAIINRESVSGKAAKEYCAVNETRTSCEALLANGNACTSPKNCGDGSFCITLDNDRLCTNRCDEDDECVGNFQCNALQFCSPPR